MHIICTDVDTDVGMDVSSQARALRGDIPAGDIPAGDILDQGRT